MGRPSLDSGLDQDDLLIRLYALDAVDIEPLRTDLMARLEHHRDRFERYERILNKRFPDGTASHADTGKLLGLHVGLRYERMVAEWCEEAIAALSAISGAGSVVPLRGSHRRVVGNIRRRQRRAVRCSSTQKRPVLTIKAALIAAP